MSHSTRLPLPARAQAALKVHALLRAPRWAVKGEAAFAIDVYENCREHGFRLFIGNPGSDERVEISFSEYRNSDDIVVYVSLPGERFEAHGVPTDRAYNAKRFFPWNRADRAAKYIQEIIDRVLNEAYVVEGSNRA